MKKFILDFFYQRRKIEKLKAVIKKLRSDSFYYENQLMLRKINLEIGRAEILLTEAKNLTQKSKQLLGEESNG